MSTYNHVMLVLGHMRPLEILEVCSLEDGESLSEALSDWIEDNLEDIEAKLISYGFLGEDE